MKYKLNSENFKRKKKGLIKLIYNVKLILPHLKQHKKNLKQNNKRLWKLPRSCKINFSVFKAFKMYSN